MRTRPRKSGWLIIAVLQLSACSHYRMPVAVLDTPEVGGADRVGRVEMLSIHSGVNLSDPGSLQKDGTTKLGMSVPMLMVDSRARSRTSLRQGFAFNLLHPL